ncbi:hypothetical protein OKW50_008102 [Paraburkholderia youngii]
MNVSTAAIAVDDFWLAQWSATRAADRRDGIDQRQQLGDIVTVCAGQNHADRYPVGIYKDVVLRTRARAIRVFGPGSMTLYGRLLFCEGFRTL